MPSSLRIRARSRTAPSSDERDVMLGQRLLAASRAHAVRAVVGGDVTASALPHARRGSPRRQDRHGGSRLLSMDSARARKLLSSQARRVGPAGSHSRSSKTNRGRHRLRQWPRGGRIVAPAQVAGNHITCVVISLDLKRRHVDRTASRASARPEADNGYVAFSMSDGVHPREPRPDRHHGDVSPHDLRARGGGHRSPARPNRAAPSAVRPDREPNRCPHGA